MVHASDYVNLSDNDAIDAAILDRDADGVVVIGKRALANEPERDFWLLDRAILLPENTTVVLENCKIKLSDRCRDNFFRTANCGMGIEDPLPISNVHIRGEGFSVLEGADHPRAVGDSSKALACPCPYTVEDLCRLAEWIPEERRESGNLTFDERHNHSYGTDANDINESQMGDWRGIGILFANVDHFSISGLKIVDSHGWAVSLEACSNGRVERMELDARMSKMIDGMLNNMENQDGIDLRNGCHHIVVSDITGRTGDDVIALTAIADQPYRPGGSLCNTHVMHNDWSRRDASIHDVIIRNVIAYSNLCYVVRLLSCNTEIRDIVVDGIIDATPEPSEHSGTIVIGDADSIYGKNLPDGMKNITISNVICNGKKSGIKIAGYLKDSVIANVVNKNPSVPMFKITRENALENVLISNVSTSGEISKIVIE